MDPTLLTALAAANAARANGDASGGQSGRALAAAHPHDQCLAVYGTLAPGEPNHAQIAACHGTWRPGCVPGHRAMRRHPVFRFDPSAPLVPVQVLRSVALPGHWATLDAFEGDEYRRILVPVLVAGSWQVANLYEAVAPVP
jgi:gamma-glutamylcyclotransferase (GGCT)/AIG2-like uncharacterized protein YtfP